MQRMGTTATVLAADRKSVEAAVRMLAASEGRAESLEEVAHDARNMVAALGLYCDLLEEPGVLTESHTHYSRELRQVAIASWRLVEKLATLGPKTTGPGPNFWRKETDSSSRWSVPITGNGGNRTYDEYWDLAPAAPVANLAAELLASRKLLSALAGPAIAVTVDAEGGARPARVTTEDLTRVLVNLVKNAVESMPAPAGGRIHIALQERAGKDGDCLVLSVEDNGRGIPDYALERIFESGFTGHMREGGRPATHRGLGLSITRAIVEAGGGAIHAENGASGGARMVIELPAHR